MDMNYEEILNEIGYVRHYWTTWELSKLLLLLEDQWVACLFWSLRILARTMSDASSRLLLLRDTARGV